MRSGAPFATVSAPRPVIRCMHPKPDNIMSHEKFATCIDACLECANECEHCATACLNEKDVAHMAKCIEIERYCADLCRMSAAFMARSSEATEHYAKELCALCAHVCEDCAKECDKHSDMEHCKACAEACRECAKACKEMSVKSNGVHQPA